MCIIRPPQALWEVAPQEMFCGCSYLVVYSSKRLKILSRMLLGSKKIIPSCYMSKYWLFFFFNFHYYFLVSFLVFQTSEISLWLIDHLYCPICGKKRVWDMFINHSSFPPYPYLMCQILKGMSSKCPTSTEFHWVSTAWYLFYVILFRLYMYSSASLFIIGSLFFCFFWMCKMLHLWIPLAVVKNCFYYFFKEI